MIKKRPRKQKLSLFTKGKIDLFLFLSVISISLFGILVVYDASVIEAYSNFSDKYYFVKQQLIWTVAGLLLASVLSFVHYGIYRKIGPWAMVISLLTLLLVLIPSVGSKVQGARRWLDLGFTRFQPAELTKLSLILYLSSLLEKKGKLMQFLVILAALILLLMLEPDLGTALILAGISFSMYFLSGGPLSHFFIMLISGVVTVAIFIFTSEYRKARVMTFINPTADPLGASYHIRQILIALGSGGLLGVGIGKSRQKYEYIPAATTDSIFSIMAEEIGFIGCTAVIVVFMMIIIRMFKIAKQAPDHYGQILGAGISSWIGIQIILNLATMVALVPLTGVPLPFISYGGSSTIVNLAGIGIILNISRNAKKS